MRTKTPELTALLASGQFVKCHLFTLTLIGGQVYHWTDADVDVTARVSGQTYSSTGPSISGARYQLVRGLQVDTLDLQAMVSDSDTLVGVSWPIAVRSGALDGATMLVEKAFMADWGQPAETLEIFSGIVDGPECVDLAVTLPVVSDASRFSQMVPNLSFLPSCWRTLYSAGCTVNRAAYTFNGSVTGTSSKSAFFTGLTQADGYFSLGTITFTSGQNAGVRRAIKSYANAQGRIELSYPLVFGVAVGDAFTVTAGCDKTQTTCNGRFGNLANFKGTPYVPKPEAIL